MKRFFIAATLTALLGTSSALAEVCHEPEYPWPNDGVCVFDVFCFLGRSGDMDIKDGVKMQQCHLDRSKKSDYAPPPHTEPEEPEDPQGPDGPEAPGSGF
ncbi:hypothetical protein [Maritalea sp. S77]|uniref:hypothetical protein n=1 Tax=Maritalea sp. S77 TaxID=3415125 RepID=UPI003C7A0203